MNNHEKKYEWWGVDLDSTLAEYYGLSGKITDIGVPIPKMIDRVKTWIEEGRTVKIFTARIGKIALSFHPYTNKEMVISAIQDWCEKYIGKRLEVTNEKDYGMVELWDDRVIQVIPNKGEKYVNKM